MILILTVILVLNLTMSRIENSKVRDDFNLHVRALGQRGHLDG
jgi:hypothetical protein